MKSRKIPSWLLPLGLPVLVVAIIVAYVIIARVVETRVSAAQVTSTVSPTAIASGTAVPGVTATVQPAASTATPAATATPTGTPTAAATATPTGTPTTAVTATATGTPVIGENPGTVLANNLVLRAGPGTAYASLGLLAAGTSFTALGQDSSGEWLYIVLANGQTGWVYRPYTSYTGTAPFVPAPPLPATAVATPTPTSQPAPTPTPSAPDNSWLGQYYANPSLSGDPTLTRMDPSLNFNWGAGSPDPSLPANYFSARWTGIWTFSGGAYQFYALVDDGVRMYVDGALVVNAWNIGSERLVSGDINLSAGQHTVTVEYFQATGVAMINAGWTQSPGSINPPIYNWRGEYFNNPSLSGSPVMVRDDPTINFNWGVDGPQNGVPAENFSVRWSRWYTFDAGIYEFSARADDGVRVYVDGNPIIDEWHDSPGETTYTARLLLNGPHWLVVEYYQHLGGALVQVSWAGLAPTPTSTATATPTATLEPTSTPTVPATSTATPTSTPGATETPAPPTPSATSTPTLTVTPTPTATQLPTSTPEATPTSLPAATPTETPSPTPTPAIAPTSTATPAQPNLTGQWRGTAQPGARVWTIQITQDGSSLAGTIQLTAASGQPGGLLGGLLANSSLQGEEVHLETGPMFSNEPMQGPLKLRFDGTLDPAGNTISGAWSDTSGQGGTIVLRRS